MTGSSDRDGDTLLSMLPMSDRAKADLVRRMSEPSRHYHTMKHLDVIWGRHLHYGPTANFCGAPIELPIAFAIAFHDSVYVGGAADNEERSAALWLEVSADDPQMSDSDRLWVADTIRATAAHIEAARAIDQGDPRGHARQWVLDLDLTPLGEPPDVFDANMKQLGAELPHLSATQRGESLRDALRSFARAERLYQSPELASAFEHQAHENIRRILGGDDASVVRHAGSSRAHDFTRR